LHTIDDRTKLLGYTHGFDYLRLILATSVLLWHSIIISYGTNTDQPVLEGWIGPLVRLILPMFFTLSGFLVAGSMARCKTVTEFVTLRVLRIFPALSAEILLSALLLGPLFTHWTLDAYFADGKFWSYLLNMFGMIHYLLPGVFVDNPRPDVVNLSLWTVPAELECYIALVSLTVLGVFRRRPMFLVALLLLTIIFSGYDWANGQFENDGLASPRLLVLSFLTGVTFSLYSDRIPLNAGLAALSAVLSYWILSGGPIPFFCAIPVGYLTIWLGMSHPPRIPVLMKGDFSYGIYLFAFPIQQCIAQMPWTRMWWLNSMLALPIVLMWSALSWYNIEKPLLGKKKKVVAAVESRLSRIGESWLCRNTLGRLTALHPAVAPMLAFVVSALYVAYKVRMNLLYG
jgi:peptidoglycan/LPS O-acetylase OafA/YrhL